MARGKSLTVLLDQELYARLEMDAETNEISLSAAARDLLRTALGTVPSPRARGWREGFMEGKAEAKRVVNEALHRVELDGGG